MRDGTVSMRRVAFPLRHAIVLRIVRIMAADSATWVGTKHCREARCKHRQEQGETSSYLCSQDDAGYWRAHDSRKKGSHGDNPECSGICGYARQPVNANSSERDAGLRAENKHRRKQPTWGAGRV